jgi:hypothetical protein
MRKLFMIICLVATATIASADDAVHINGIIDGKQLELKPEMKERLADDSLGLLSSCMYWSALWYSNPSCYTNSSCFAEVQKGSHLHFVFAKPRTIDVKLADIDVRVEVYEMVITLPLASGQVWVKTKSTTSYFAKFTPHSRGVLEDTIEEAQKP